MLGEWGARSRSVAQGVAPSRHTPAAQWRSCSSVATIYAILRAIRRRGPWTKGSLTSAGIYLVGMFLVAIGVAVWLNGNTTFGGTLGVFGILCVIFRFSYMRQERRTKAAHETRPEVREETEETKGSKDWTLAPFVPPYPMAADNPAMSAAIRL